MKITILTYGSSGDVLPYISLALGLNESGHQVTLAAPSNFESVVTGYGLNYCPIFGDMREILNSPLGKKWMGTKNAVTFSWALSKIFYRNRVEMQRDMLAACEGTEAIIGGSMVLIYACMLSEKLGVPLLAANVNPVGVLTGAFPHFLVASKPFRLKILNQATYFMMAAAHEIGQRHIINEWRKDLGLGKLKGSTFIKMIQLKVPVILGYSPDILPQPEDWHDYICVTGEWKLEPHFKRPYKPDPVLQDWLNSGPPPVYFGFGSMPVPNPNQMVKMVEDICERRGIRAVVNAGWSNFAAGDTITNNQVYTVDHTDLEWLFPQCSHIVHHGGVGTTHLSLASGVPTVICSVFADNAFWGERLKKLDAGKHIRYKDITKDKIITTLAELEKEGIRANARNLGDKIKAGRGLKNAVDFINKHLDTAPVYED